MGDLLERAAKQDNAAALFHLGVKYDRGNGVSVDKQKAEQLWERAAAHCHPGAMFHLGARFEKDNFERTLDLWERAAAQGHTGALFSLGNKYNQGSGVKLD